MRSMRRLVPCLALSAVALFGGTGGRPEGETPLASRSIQLGTGSVDAISGNLTLRVPLGPRLPGRIPVGFTWTFENQDSLQSARAAGGNPMDAVGGNIRPVVWPSFDHFGNSPLQCTVQVDGLAMVFHKRYSTGQMPSLSALQDRMAERQVRPVPPTVPPPGYLLEDPGTLQITGALPSSDGTKFIVSFAYLSTLEKFDKNTQTSVYSTRYLAPGYAIIEGVNAIWTQRGHGVSVPGHQVTHFTNRWGDHISVDELETQVDGGFLVLTQVVITDEVAPDNSLTMELVCSGTPTTSRTSGIDARSGLAYDEPSLFHSTASVRITNTLGLPEATMTGHYGAKQRFTPGPARGCPGYDLLASPSPEGLWDHGFMPTDITKTAGSESKAITISWAAGAWPQGSPSQIVYPNGLQETFQYGTVARLSALSFSKCDGAWTGFAHLRGSGDLEEELGDFSVPGVTQISRQSVSPNGGQGERFRILRVQPWWLGTPSGQNSTTWTCQEFSNQTAVLHYPDPEPGSETPFRAIRFIHPDYGLDLDVAGPAGYLFATKAILFEESLVGSGTSATRPQDLGSSPYQVISFDGFDLRSWANPSGSIANGLPVTAVALRSTVYAENQPTKITVGGNPNTVGARDEYGPIITDEYVDVPRVFPLPSGAAVPLWGKDLPASESSWATWRRGKVSRAMDWNLVRLLPITSRKTLRMDGSQAGARRYLAPNSGATPAAPTAMLSDADFGETAYSYDEMGRITQQKGDRGEFLAVEDRSYLPGLPLLQASTKQPLTGPGGPYHPNPDLPEVRSRKTFTWLNTHLQAGPSTSVDEADGRTESFTYHAQLGREESRTDVLGVTTTTEYDSWGRPWRIVRQPKGGVGSVVKEFTFDPGGRWKEESVTSDGKTLRARTEMDAFGRVVTISTFAGIDLATVQTFDYDGFGQKISQSPVRTRTQASWGDESFVYDDRGRLVERRDSHARTVQKVLLQPTWQILGGIPAIWTTSQDDRGFQRSEGVDLLGQKRAVIDQLGQLSEYFYDQDGHLLQTLQRTATGAQQRAYTYNAMGWMTSRTEPEEGRTEYSKFTLFGVPLVVQQFGRTGGATARNTITTTLDAHLRPDTMMATGAEGTVTRTLSYDPDPGDLRLLRTVFETSSIPGLGDQTLSESYDYDGLGRLTAKTVSDGLQAFTVTRTLNDAGSVTSLTYPSGGGKTGVTVSTSYDGLARPLAVKSNGALRGMMTYDLIDGTSVTNILTFGNGATSLSKSDQGELTLTEHATRGGVVESHAVSWSPGGLMLRRGQDTFDYDGLQRLTESHVYGVFGEKVDQWFTYDGFGNRATHHFQYTEGQAGSSQPHELRAWRADHTTNDLPQTITALSAGAPGTAAAIGTYDTGALYGDLGRMDRVDPVPGDPSTRTTWIYDPSGRVVMENGTRYLLDVEGLRFRRSRSDGSLDYTIYGFGREPLAQFSIPASTQVQSATLNAPTARTRSKSKAQLKPTQEPAGASIAEPSGPITVAPGAIIRFVGNTDFGTRLIWVFGDDSSAFGATVSHAFTTPGIYRVSFKAIASGHRTSMASVQVTVMPKPSITGFAATPASIDPGQSSTLSWTTSGAATVSIDQGVGSMAEAGSWGVAPSRTTTYTLTATNAAGSVTATTTVGVSSPAPPSIRSFTAAPGIIAAGQGTVLSWQVEDATDTTLQGIGKVTGTSCEVRPTETTTYVLTATNLAGSSTTSVTVVVETQLPVISGFYATPDFVTPGGSTTLAWYVSQADSCTINEVPVTGSSALYTPSGTTTYTLVATNLVGSLSATVTVNVGSPGALIWRKYIVYGFGQVLSEEQPGVGTAYVQSDYVGSPSIITNPDGTLIGRSKNLPFGERMARWGATPLRRYTNHEDDPDSEAIHMQAREYLPAYAKFAQVDPAYDQTKDDPETWNLYSYVTNNPVTHTDPDGRANSFGGWNDSAFPSYFAPEFSGPSDPWLPENQYRGLSANLAGGFSNYNAQMDLISAAYQFDSAQQYAKEHNKPKVQLFVYVNGKYHETTALAFFDVYINGMNNTIEEAGNIARDEFKRVGISNFNLVYIPTLGFWKDVFRAMADKLGLTTPTAASLVPVLLGARRGTRWYAHSYGAIAFTEAARVIGNNGGSLAGDRVAFLAGANSPITTSSILRRVGVGLIGRGYYDSPFDVVPQVLGMHSPSPLQWLVAISLSWSLFFPSISPHHLPPMPTREEIFQ